ncbi:PhnD/SsuA/transferrin family substrate-binding protein, partial [Paracoccus sp. 22332]
MRAVADGLVRSGSVDGYVWEALAVIEPGLTARTRVIARSEWLGFPPVCARRDSLASEPVQALQTALMNLAETEEGRQRREGPQIKHDVAVPVARLADFVALTEPMLSKILP